MTDDITAMRTRMLYCPEHGDLLAGNISYRCANAPKNHEYVATAAEAFRELGIKHKAERDAALAAIERVRAIHKLGWQQEPYGNGPDGQVLEHAVSWCLHCDMASPCDTLAALDWAPEPEWEWGLRDADCGMTYVVGRPKDSAISSGRYLRRLQAGPWEPVDAEQIFGKETQDESVVDG